MLLAAQHCLLLSTLMSLVPGQQFHEPRQHQHQVLHNDVHLEREFQESNVQCVLWIEQRSFRYSKYI